MSPSSVPTTEVAQLPDPLPDELTVLDVREQVEWDHGHIPGATHVPIMELTGRAEELPEGEVLVVCRVGARSAQVVQWLQQAGRPAVNLDGGMIEWVAAGRRIVSENGEEPRIV